MADLTLSPAPADPVPGLTDEDARAREQSRHSLRTYLRSMFPIVDPRTALVEGWYLDAMCDHAQAFVLRQIHNIVVTIPPRMLKSTVWSIAMPTWAWTRKATHRFLVGSYPGGPNIDHAIRARTVIQSLWYQRNFSDQVRLRTDQNEKDYYENTAGGYRITTHVGGGTGKGGDFTILDDPHNIEDSKATIASAIEWHDTVWFGRLDDLKTGGRAVILQRIDPDDLAGHLIASGEYVHLNLPQEYSAKRMVTVESGVRLPPKATPLGWVDPRTEEGALLCPARMGPVEVAAARKMLKGNYSAQQNQDPTPESGILFKREWFTQIVPAAPPEAVRCRGWDAAASEGRGDFTAGVKMAWARDGKIYVEHVCRGQWGATKADQEMFAQIKIDGRLCHQFEEQEPGSSGKKVVIAHQQTFKGYSYSFETAGTDKVTKSRAFQSECGAGNVYLVAGAWNLEYIDELCSFPKGTHDDQVDGSAGAYNWLVENRPPEDLVVG